MIAQLENGTIHAIAQDESPATFTSKINAQDHIMDWNRTAFEIHNQIRALSPEPSAWTSLELGGQLKKLKTKRSSIVKTLKATPKQIHLLTSKEWVVECI